jgi:hypothetical protein
MKRGLILSALLVVGALSATISAPMQARDWRSVGQQTPSAAVIQVDEVWDNLYVLRGGGGNTAAFISFPKHQVRQDRQILPKALSQNALGALYTRPMRRVS